MNISSASVQTTILASESGSGGLSTRSAQIGYQDTIALTNGTGANQVNEFFDDVRTLTASSNETLNLNDGSLKDSFGASVVATAIKLIHIKNTSTTQTLTVGGATNPFLGPMGGTTPTQTIPPGQSLTWPNFTATGWAISGGVNDSLKIANSSGASAIYKIIVSMKV